MAQLTYEWQELGTVYAGNTGYGDVYLNFMGILVSQNTSSNKSRVGIGLRIYTSNGSWSSQMNDTLDGNYQDLGYRSFSAGHEFIHIIEKDIPHNNDGTGSGSFNGSMWTYFFGTTSGSASFTLPTIPRYASISSFSVSQRDETSVTYDWKTNATIDYVWYRYKKTSASSYGSWTGYNTPDGTSGSFTVSGLSAGTKYDFQLRVRRKDSQLNTDSGVKQQETYNYPYVKNINNKSLIIGNSQTLTLYNPLSRSCSIYMKKDNTSGTEFYSGTTSGTSITFTPDSEIMYNSIPDSSKGNCVYYCTYSGHTVSTYNDEFLINANECIPTFEDFEYSTDLSNLTGDNDTIINGKTTTTFTVSASNKATAKNYATISRYKLECGSVTPIEINESDSDLTGTLANCNDAIIKVTAIDSRGVEKTVSKTVGNFKNYVGPSISSIQVERKDGVDAETNLDFVVNYWNYSFGSVTNEITEVAYRVKQSSSSAWSEWYDDINVSHITYSDDKATLTDELIHENGTSGGFTVGTQFDIQVKISDGNSSYILSSVESNILTLTDGSVAISVNKDSNGEYHIGINGMPNSNYKLYVNGNIMASNMVRMYMDSNNNLYITDDGSDPNPNA